MSVGGRKASDKSKQPKLLPVIEATPLAQVPSDDSFLNTGKIDKKVLVNLATSNAAKGLLDFLSPEKKRPRTIIPDQNKGLLPSPRSIKPKNPVPSMTLTNFGNFRPRRPSPDAPTMHSLGSTCQQFYKQRQTEDQQRSISAPRPSTRGRDLVKRVVSPNSMLGTLYYPKKDQQVLNKLQPNEVSQSVLAAAMKFRSPKGMFFKKTGMSAALKKIDNRMSAVTEYRHQLQLNDVLVQKRKDEAQQEADKKYERDLQNKAIQAKLQILGEEPHTSGIERSPKTARLIVDLAKRVHYNTEFKLEVSPDYLSFSVTLYRTAMGKNESEEYGIHHFMQRFNKLFHDYMIARSIVPSYIGVRLGQYVNNNYACVFVYDNGGTKFVDPDECMKRLEMFYEIPRSDFWQRKESSPAKKHLVYCQCPIEKYPEVLGDLYSTSVYLQTILLDFQQTREVLLERSQQAQMAACVKTIDSATEMFRSNCYRGRTMPLRMGNLPGLIEGLRAEMDNSKNIGRGIENEVLDFERFYGELEFVAGIKGRERKGGGLVIKVDGKDG